MANAQTTFKVGDVTYLVTKAGQTVEVNDVDSKATSVTVPATVENEGTKYTVTAVGEEAFKWSDASEIVLPETVDSIKKSAFTSTSNLKTITLPSRLKYIGDYAFNSSALTSIDIPASVEEIGGSAFFTAKSLTQITFHEGLKRIGRSAFYKCPLTSVTLPESVDSLEKTFMNCDQLTTVKLPSKLTYLGDGVFYQSGLTSIDLPATLKYIGSECFLKTKITSLNIPASVDSLGTSIIAQTGVSSLTVDKDNKYFHLVDGVLYDVNNRLLYAVPQKGMTEVNVAAGCLGINGGAFWGSEVRKVTLPESVLAIDDYAFCQSPLESINFPAGLLFIGEQGFASTQLTDVTLPENMPYVMDGSFAGCEKLTSLTIPSGVKYIYNHAFHSDKALKSITCLGSVAPTLADVYEEYDGPFYGIDQSTPLYVPKGCAESYENAYYGDYLTITETDKGVLKVESTTPDSGAVVYTKSGWTDASFTVTFTDDITIADEAPRAFLRKASLLSAKTVNPDDGWHAVKDDAKTLRIWGSDYDGYTFQYKIEDSDYYMVIPAGVVKNAAGETNEQIVISYKGSTTPSGITAPQTETGNATVVARYDLAGHLLSAPRKGVNIVKMSDGTVRKEIVK